MSFVQSEAFAVVHLPDVISSLGRLEFGARLTVALSSICDFDRCSMIVYRRRETPLVLFSTCQADRIGGATPCDHYVAGLYRHDPVFDMADKPSNMPDLLVHLRRDDIWDSRYRQRCFDAAGTSERVSLLEPGTGQCVVLNLYRSVDSCRFSEGDLAALRDVRALVASLTAAHSRIALGDAGPRKREERRAMIESRLLMKCPDLSGRELSVCALAVLGLNTEAVGLELGVGIASVQTYRKRAYRKLNVSTGNELFDICLGRDTRA